MNGTDDLLGGYTRDQLTAAFDLVKDPENWKNPIDTTIPTPSDEDWRMIEFAVIFFTGSIAGRIRSEDGTTVQVLADGYYLSIGS